ncbi:MAG: hypothetical protein V4727_06225 [Verrucomicrobiota bacterium]
MARLITKLIAWLAKKLVVYAVILAILLAIFLVKFLPTMIVDHREAQLEKAVAELSQSRALVGELAAQVEQLTKQMDEKRKQLRELEAKHQKLEEFFQKVKDLFRRDEVLAEQKRIEAQQAKLRKEVTELSNSRRDIRIQGGESEDEVMRRQLLLDEKQKQLSEIEQLRDAMDDLMQNQLKQLAFQAFLILLVLLLIPFLWKVTAFYLFAPIVQSSKPIALGDGLAETEKISVTSSHPAQRLHLNQGEVLLTRVDYLQGSMGNFEKSTKWLMDWHYPFSSLAAGLCILTKIQNAGEQAGDVTLSTQEDATEELAVVEIPAGVSLVFRPNFLIAVCYPAENPPRIRSKWVFRKLHAWVNLQFRYLIIDGPTQLVFSAQRGIQVENVSQSALGRRVNARLVVAFSPQLEYSPRRAETFVAYLWGKNALFDDYFQGSGTVIQQQVTGGKRNPIARFWESIFGAIGKVFGI